jgi:hypothetical protein
VTSRLATAILALVVAASSLRASSAQWDFARESHITAAVDPHSPSEPRAPETPQGLISSCAAHAPLAIFLLALACPVSMSSVTAIGPGDGHERRVERPPTPSLFSN